MPHSTVFWLSGNLRHGLLLTLCFTNIFCFAQTPKSSTPKRYCPQDAGFCFTYPATWTMLEQYPTIIAPQQTLDRDLWDVVTLAAVVPPPAEGQPAMSIDQVIQTAMSNMKASGRDVTTLQRRELTLAGLPAQMIRIRYHDDPSGRDWIEQLVFIDGPDQEIYSIALKAQPGTIARLEPAFDAIVRSWKLEVSQSPGPQPLPPPRGKPASPVPH